MRSRSVMIVSAALLASLLGGSAFAGSDDNNAVGLARQLAGLTQGKPVMCLAQFRGQSSVRAYGDDLLYSFGNARKYVTHTSGGCSNAGRGDILITEQFSGRPCSGDIARTIDRTSHFPTGSCALGDFVEYHK